MSGEDWITLVLTLTFLISCIQPFFGCFYRTARTELLKVIIEIFKAPFGKVRFRDFFFADIITSMSVPLVDMALVFSYFKQGSWKSQDREVEDTPALEGYKIVMMILPFSSRFSLRIQ